ncbi:hypothetical protein Henu3_gp104 [Mycobacterium phage Henu3 PeY-2017]|nr:hypothetical protein Henu3_gp104 [Mycobacterium phage Henu3 PeY-2017]
MFVLLRSFCEPPEVDDPTGQRLVAVVDVSASWLVGLPAEFRTKGFAELGDHLFPFWSGHALPFSSRFTRSGHSCCP